jgi:hypothetical protein
MTHFEYLTNYCNDLQCSKSTPLLIELVQGEIQKLNEGLKKENLEYSPLLIAKQVYNDNQTGKGNNIIVIDGNDSSSQDNFILLEILIEQLRNELKGIKNLATLKESIKAAAYFTTGGLLDDLVGDHLDKGFNAIFNEVNDYFSSLLTEVAISNIDLSKPLLSAIENILHDTTGNQLGDLVNTISKTSFNLSSPAKSELNSLSITFSKIKNIDAFQLTFKLLLAIALDRPKLIYINNPHKLDNNSIGMLSLLLSFAKNQKALDKHIGISVVYTYTDEKFHLYNDVSEELQSKQLLLASQRRFAQRYAMLEKPGSDIPKIAVKSSLFIGRNLEIKELLSQFANRKPITFSVISGEPGIGKTALVNNFLANIQKQDQVIILTLLNEVGHTSTNTGLSSLEKSIVDETKRFELLASWKNKASNFFKNIITKDNIIKTIGTIVPGSDKAVAIIDSGYQRLMIDDHIDIVKNSGDGNLDTKNINEKQQQFNELEKKLRKLKNVLSEALPLVLFIDDLQWIDDSASEFILTRLLKQPDLYIISTLRPSDGATILREQLTSPSLHVYSLALLKACQVRGFEKCTDISDSEMLQTKILLLNGFDKPLLSALIAKVIHGNTSQCEALANSIFNALTNLNSKDVNPLFSIETINMLCDKRLYTENSFDRLILDSPLRFNSELKHIETTLIKTFAALQSKYQDSLSHANQDCEGKRFNLMAYAVLEERLHLLKIYFGKQGNVAVNSLLFASLLGAPFSSSLVQKVLQITINAEPPEGEVPLKVFFGECPSKTIMDIEHYVILEEVYDILRRMPDTHDKYQYRHILLNTFFNKQFDYLLDKWSIANLSNSTKLTGTRSPKYKFFKKIENFIRSEMKSRNLSLESLRTPDDCTKDDLDQIRFYMRAQLNIAVKQSEWMRIGALSLGWRVMNYLGDIGESYGCLFREIDRTRYIESRHSSFQGQAYFMLKPMNIFSTNSTYLFMGDPPSDYIYFCKSQKLNNHSNIEATRGKYEKDNKKWFLYAYFLECLTYEHCSNERISDAIEVVKTSIAITKPFFEEKPEIWGENFARRRLNLAILFEKSGRSRNAIVTLERLIALLEVMNKCNQKDWNGIYLACLNHLTHIYSRKAGVLRKAFENYDLAKEPKPLDIFGTKSPFLENGHHNKSPYIKRALQLERRAHKIYDNMLSNNLELWPMSYEMHIDNYSTNLYFNNQITLAEELYTSLESKFYRHPLIIIYPIRIHLERLIQLYKRSNNPNKVYDLYINMLNLIEPYLNESPFLFKREYIEIAYKYHADLGCTRRTPQTKIRAKKLIERISGVLGHRL